MPNLCPLCNGFYSLNLKCSCGSLLKDMGRLENYAGPYSPYQDFEEEPSAREKRSPEGAEGCLHLMACPGCRREERVMIREKPG